MRLPTIENPPPAEDEPPTTPPSVVCGSSVSAGSLPIHPSPSPGGAVAAASALVVGGAIMALSAVPTSVAYSFIAKLGLDEYNAVKSAAPWNHRRRAARIRHAVAATPAAMIRIGSPWVAVRLSPKPQVSDVHS
jgi:hypothetical protein